MNKSEMLNHSKNSQGATWTRLTFSNADVCIILCWDIQDNMMQWLQEMLQDPSNKTLLNTVERPYNEMTCITKK